MPPVTHSSGNTAQTVHIFCCTQESCAARSDSWRAFTHVSPRGEGSEGNRQDTNQSPSASGRQTSSVSAAEVHKHHEGSCDAKADAWDLSSNAWGIESRQNEAHSTSGTEPQAPSLDAAQVPKGSAAAETDTWGLSSDDWGISNAEPAGADVTELNSALEELSMQPTCHSKVGPRSLIDTHSDGLHFCIAPAASAAIPPSVLSAHIIKAPALAGHGHVSWQSGLLTML